MGNKITLNRKKETASSIHYTDGFNPIDVDNHELKNTNHTNRQSKKDTVYGYCMTPDCYKKHELPYKNCSRIDCDSCGISWCITCGVAFHEEYTCRQYQNQLNDDGYHEDIHIANNLEMQQQQVYDEFVENAVEPHRYICVSCKHKMYIDDVFKWTKCKHEYCIQCADTIVIESLFQQKIPNCIKCNYGQLLSVVDAKHILTSEELNMFELIQQGIVIDFNDDYINNDGIDERILLIFGWFRQHNNWRKCVGTDILLLCVGYYRPYFIKSNMINNITCTHLFDLLSQRNIFKNYKSTERIYCGSLDGFDVQSLYTKMYTYSNDEATVLLIETDSGSIFGVYITICWKLAGDGYDANSFIFSLQTDLMVNTQIFDIKSSYKDNAVCYAEDDNSDFLVSFGSRGCCSIFLGQNCNTRDNSYCSISGNSAYKIPKDVIICGGLGDDENEFVDIIRRFKVIDFEIHQFKKY